MIFIIEAEMIDSATKPQSRQRELAGTANTSGGAVVSSNEPK